MGRIHCRLLHITVAVKWTRFLKISFYAQSAQKVTCAANFISASCLFMLQKHCRFIADFPIDEEVYIYSVMDFAVKTLQICCKLHIGRLKINCQHNPHQKWQIQTCTIWCGFACAYLVVEMLQVFHFYSVQTYAKESLSLSHYHCDALIKLYCQTVFTCCINLVVMSHFLSHFLEITAKTVTLPQCRNTAIHFFAST